MRVAHPTVNPKQVTHPERGGGHAARTRHYLYGKPAYCKLPYEVGMEAAFEARLQRLCLAQKAEFKVMHHVMHHVMQHVMHRRRPSSR